MSVLRDVLTKVVGEERAEHLFEVLVVPAAARC